MKIFNTTSLLLASAILSEIDGCSFEEIDRHNLVNGKWIIKLSYPEDKKEAVQKLVEDFDNKELVVNLSCYHKNMIFLKNKLFETNKTGR